MSFCTTSRTSRLKCAILPTRGNVDMIRRPLAVSNSAQSSPWIGRSLTSARGSSENRRVKGRGPKQPDRASLLFHRNRAYNRLNFSHVPCVKCGLKRETPAPMIFDRTKSATAGAWSRRCNHRANLVVGDFGLHLPDQVLAIAKCPPHQ